MEEEELVDVSARMRRFRIVGMSLWSKVMGSWRIIASECSSENMPQSQVFR